MVNGAAGRGLVAFAYASSLSVRHRRGTDWLRRGEVTTYFPLPAVRRVAPKRYYFAAIHNKAMPVSIGHLILKTRSIYERQQTCESVCTNVSDSHCYVGR